MTVRTWFTISTLVLVALTVAIFVRLLAPVSAPVVLARVGSTRIDGQRVEACWPQRGNELRCEDRSDAPTATTVPPEGTFRIIVAYPAQPQDGSLRITQDGKTKPIERTDDWEDELDYDLDAGTYTLIAEAKYPDGAKLTYRFPFRVA